MVTHGCTALTGMQSKDIVLTMMRPGESDEDVERRIGHGYRVHKIEYKQTKANAIGSFQDFRKTYQPAKPIYKCIYCGGNCGVVKEESKEDFMAHGRIEVRDVS
jgi:hypothetical protein